MAGKTPDSGPTATTVVANLKRLRTDANLTYTQLSTRLRDAHWSISPVGVRRIEDGERRVTVDDLLAFAVALGVSPLTLLMPDAGEGDKLVTATGITDKCQAEQLWAWLLVYEPLDPSVSTLKYRLKALPSWKRTQMEANTKYVDVQFSGGSELAPKAE